MRLEETCQLKDGQLVAKHIYDSGLNVLVKKGTPVTSAVKEVLQSAAIPYIYINDALSEGIVIDPMISDDDKFQMVRCMKNVCDGILAHRAHIAPPGLSFLYGIEAIADQLFNALASGIDKTYYTTELLGEQIYHYDHAIETAFLALCIGERIGLDHKTLRAMVVGALLADVGKILVPDALLYKTTPLSASEYDALKAHVQYGEHLTRAYFNVGSFSEEIILNHHERLDGSGYPKGIGASKLPLHVRIVTICDMFTAMVSDRVYNQRISVSDALTELRKHAPHQVDIDSLQLLHQVVQLYPQGTFVILSDGRLGIVKAVNAHSPSRPVIHLIEGDALGAVVDLMDDLTVFIKEAPQSRCCF